MLHHALLLALILIPSAALDLVSADWPEFRGPHGDGRADATGLPLTWSEKDNVVWKTPIPHRGWSTPVVANNQIWLTSATIDGRDSFALCVDATNGAVRFQEKIFHTDKPEPLGNNINCYASPSPVLDDQRVYVHFGSYGTACLDATTAKILWQRRDLPCRHFRGPGSSPIVFKDLLILSLDGIDVQYLTALDKRSGKTVWTTQRSAVWDDLDAKGKPLQDGDLRKAFSTPLVVEPDGTPMLLSVGAKAAYAYDALSGRELWKVRHTCYSAAARPVFGQGLAFFATGWGKSELWAVRTGGQGDVSGSHLAWKILQGAPRTASPVLVDGLLYMLSDDGMATCLEAATGTVVWRERIGGSYSASPLAADGRLYCLSTQGKTTVLKLGRTREVLATNVLDDGFMASPAICGQALILRTRTHLYRIESK
jgi:outer membrane protein assembly factor BamB